MGTGDACYTGGMQVEVRGVPVHYVELGAGRPIVLLHGRPADYRLMTVAFEPIFEARPGWRRIYPDLPGMGLTPAADWIRSLDDVIDLLEGFTDAVLPGQRFALAGASYGGHLALGLMHRRAERVDGLALVAPMMTREPGDRDVPAHQVFERDEELVASLGDEEQGWLSVSVAQTRANLEGFRAGVLPGVRLADQAFLERLDAAGGLSVDVKRLPAPFTGPSLVLAGRQDSVVGYAETIPLLDSLPRATLAILDRAGHGLRMEQRDLFRALTSEWLDRLEREPDRR